jgi:hypothetical protein
MYYFCLLTLTFYEGLIFKYQNKMFWIILWDYRETNLVMWVADLNHVSGFFGNWT